MSVAQEDPFQLDDEPTPVVATAGGEVRTTL